MRFYRIYIIRALILFAMAMVLYLTQYDGVKKYDYDWVFGFSNSKLIQNGDLAQLDKICAELVDEFQGDFEGGGEFDLSYGKDRSFRLRYSGTEHHFWREFGKAYSTNLNLELQSKVAENSVTVYPLNSGGGGAGSTQKFFILSRLAFLALVVVLFILPKPGAIGA